MKQLIYNMAYTSAQLKTLAELGKTSDIVNKITDVVLYKSEINSSAQNFQIKVIGDTDAIFSMTITRSSDSRNYDFTTDAFEARVTSKSRLKNQSPGVINIAIPAASGGDTYSINIFPEPHFNTELSFFSRNKLYYSTSITQKANSIITLLGVGTGITDTTFGTSTGSITSAYADANRPTILIDNKQLTVASAITDFGYFITTTTIDVNNGTWNADAMYWQTTETADGAVASDSDQLKVDDLTGLVIGMELTYITGTTAPGSATTITAIDIDTKTLTLSRDQAITDGHTMTFRAYGLRLIQNAIGIGLSLSNPTVKLGQLTTSIRTATSSNIAAGATIAVNGTTGIGVGATIRMRGLNKSSASDECKISAVDNTSGLTAGTITLADGQLEASSDRPIRVGTKIYVDGSSNLIYLSGVLKISKYPEANQTIYIDFTKILTTGAAS